MHFAPAPHAGHCEVCMQILIALLALGVASSADPAPAASRASESLLVRAVPDGRTIVVQGIGRVRLIGLESVGGRERDEPLGGLARRSRERLGTLVLNRWVRLEYE